MSNAALKLTAAWAFISIPLVWGLVQTIINATALFR